MENLVGSVDNILSVLTVVAQVLVVLLILAKLFGQKMNFISENALGFAFVVALTALLGSLFYSEVAGYTPCKLCWYQRILMYPQVILLGIAWWKNEWMIKKYAITLSVTGALVAGFHYYEQVTPEQLTSCSTAGYSVSCAERFVTNFGYITIPMMALSAFLLIVFILLSKDCKDSDSENL